MSKARLIITAIEVEGRSPAEVIAAYGVSRSWLYELLGRYRAEGDAAFEPRSRRPHTSPRATPPATVELVLRVRKQLSDSGLDAATAGLGRHRHRHHTLGAHGRTVSAERHRRDRRGTRARRGSHQLRRPHRSRTTGGGPPPDRPRRIHPRHRGATRHHQAHRLPATRIRRRGIGTPTADP